jgi:hypothetical protein
MAAQQPTPQSARIPPDVPNDPGISGLLSAYLRNFALWCREGFAEQMRNNQALRGVMLFGYDTPPGETPPVWMLECNVQGQLGLGPMALGSRQEPGDFVPVGPIGDGDGNFGLGIAPPAGQTPADPAVSGGAIGGWLFGWGITVNNWANNLYYNGSAWQYWHDGTGMNAQLGDGFFIQRFPAGVADQIADAPTTLFNVDSGGNVTIPGRLTAVNVVTSGIYANSPGIVFPDFFNRWCAFGWDGSYAMHCRVDGATAIGKLIRSQAGGVLGPGHVAGTEIGNMALDGNTGNIYADWGDPSNCCHWAYIWGLTTEKLKSSRAAPRDALYVLEQIPVRQVEVDLPLREEPLGLDFAILPDDIRELLPEAIAGEGIRCEPLVGMLVKAVQQLSARVAELEAR